MTAPLRSLLHRTHEYLTKAYRDADAADVNPVHYLRRGKTEGRYRNVEREEMALIKASGLFDPVWYLAQYPDVAQAGVDPLRHYLRHACSEGREPGPHFWSAWYLEVFQDVKKARMNPLVRHLRNSRRDKAKHPVPDTRSPRLEDAIRTRRRPQTFNMFWHGDSLSSMESACMQSFLAHGHRLRVFTYGEVRLPEGAINEDAAQILPFDQYFTFMDSPSAFSNIFRYKLLLEEGGWWVDTDVVCLRSDVPECDYFWAVQDEYDEAGINGAVLKFPARDIRCARLLELSIERSRQISVWGQLGPRLLTEVLANDKPSGLIGTTQDAYPVRWVETYFFWLPEFAAAVDRRTSDSPFLHLWHRMFSEMGIDVNCTPPAGSYLRELCLKYGQPLPTRHEDALNTRRSIAKYLNREWNLRILTEYVGTDLTGVIPIYEDTPNLVTNWPQMRPGASPIIFGAGFFYVERDDSGQEWRWSGQQAGLLLANRYEECLLRMKAAAPLNGMTISLSMNGHSLDTFIQDAGVFEKEYSISAKQQGTAPHVKLKIATDAVFFAPHDSRALGICVFEIEWRPR